MASTWHRHAMQTLPLSLPSATAPCHDHHKGLFSFTLPRGGVSCNRSRYKQPGCPSERPQLLKRARTMRLGTLRSRSAAEEMDGAR